MVYIGIAGPSRTDVHELRLDAQLGRDGIREATARQALQHLLDASRP